ncbi:MAG TPA: GMC oxidoreductase [Candidatus Binatia bacterium]|nr:GMC oxidoreductase [Candidatus Binatia bacterium]
MTDVIVVGSGPGGVNAAAPLVAAGCRVLMLDYGNRDTRYADLVPRRPFAELRRTDPNQHRYFLGDAFEGVPVGPVRVGAQLTPPRMHILADAAARMPVDAPGFAVSMSLARGGLGAGWSAGVFPFSDDELRDTSLGLADLQRHYDAVAERIGVAGAHDDLEPFLPPSPSMMPPLEIDSNAEVVLERYRRRRAALNARGFFLGRPRVAACTRPCRGRGPYPYFDLDYWADVDRSIYRPQWTLEELERSPNFTYLDRRFVLRFAESADRISVHVVRADGGGEERHVGRAFVLAAGTLATARIVLRSLGCYDTPAPILCNAYTYVPTVNTGMLGRVPRDRRYSLGQLTAIVRLERPHEHLLQAQLFSYRSLLTFKLMKEVPLAARQSLRMLRVLLPCFAILGIHHEDRPAENKHCVLRRGEPDRLEITYRPSPDEERRQRRDERVLLRFFRRLGCLPLKAIRPGHGSSLHYAGTFPISPDDRPLTCDRDSRLRGTRAVYLADGSIFPWLPPKGLTFNIMANADRVGTLLAEKLR